MENYLDDNDYFHTFSFELSFCDVISIQACTFCGPTIGRFGGKFDFFFDYFNFFDS